MAKVWIDFKGVEVKAWLEKFCIDHEEELKMIEERMRQRLEGEILRLLKGGRKVGKRRAKKVEEKC